MNKKNIIRVIIGIVVLAAAGFVIFKAREQLFPKKRLEKVIKEREIAIDKTAIPLFAKETEIYYSFISLGDRYKEIQKSKFWEEFSSLSLWKDLEVIANLEKLTAAFKDTIGITFAEEELINLLGEELSIGITTRDNAPVISIVSKVKNSKNFKDKLALMVTEAEEQGTVNREKYQAKEITFVRSPTPAQPNVGLAFIDEETLSLVIGGSIQDNKDIIDRNAGIKEGFHTNPEFRKMFKSNIAGDGIFFLNLKAINRVTDITAGIPPLFISGTEMIEAIGGIVSFAEGITLNISILPDKGKMSDEVLKLWTKPPERANTLNYIPAKTVFYTGTTHLDVKGFFDSWKKSLGQQGTEPSQALLAGLEKLKTEDNIDVEGEIIPYLGDEVAFICSGLSAEGILPEVELTMMIESKNKAKIKVQLEEIIRSIEKSISAPGGAEGQAEALFKIETEPQTYEGVEITEIKLPLVGAGFQPCYTFIDKFAVLSTSVEGVKKLIDVKEGKIKSLKEDAQYQIIANIVTPKTNQIGYVNIEQALTASISVCEWIVSFQRLSMPKGDTPEEKIRRDEIEQTEAVLRESVIPLLKAFKVAKVLGSNTVYLKDGSINQIFKLYIKDSKPEAA